MTNDISEYLKIAFFSQAFTSTIFSDNFERPEEITSAMYRALLSYAETQSIAQVVPISALSVQIINEMKDFGCLEIEEDPLAGTYYHIKNNILDGFRNSVLSDNEIFIRSKRIGSRFFEDAFRSFLNSGESGFAVASSIIDIPASDRIVSIGHNSVDELKPSINDLIQSVSSDNGDPEDPNFRSRILGQLKAGREFIDAGTFKLWLLKETLLTALGELIQRYSGKAIGIAAQKLLELILDHIFKA